MKRATSLARLGLLACFAGVLAACGAVQPPTAMHVLQAAQQDVATTDHQIGKDAHHGLSRALSDEENKLYAKGFKDGYTDSTRAHRFPKQHRKELLAKRQYDDRHSTGYANTASSTTCQSTPSGGTLCAPTQTSPKSEKTLIAEEAAPEALSL